VSSAFSSLDRSPEGDVLLAGDTSGALRLFRWPVREPAAGHRRYGGHGAGVCAVSFSYDDRFVASCGLDAARSLL